MNTRKIATLVALELAGRNMLMTEGEGTTTAPAGGSAPTPTPAGAKAPVEPKAGKKAKGKAAKPKKASGKSGKNGEVTGPAVLKKYAPNYQKGGKDGKAKTASGNQTIDSGDKLADRLRGKNIDEVYADAVKVLNTALEDGQEKHTKESLFKKYGTLNLGMQRMNLGNRMRAILFPKAASAPKTPKAAKKPVAEKATTEAAK